jgi:hypothetical protein
VSRVEAILLVTAPCRQEELSADLEEDRRPRRPQLVFVPRTATRLAVNPDDEPADDDQDDKSS